MTEKVRIKSIAEMGRIVIVEVKDKEDELWNGDEDEDEDEDEMDPARPSRPPVRRNLDEIDDDSDDFAEVFAVDNYRPGAPGIWEMEVAKTYERTMELLGDELGKCD